MDANGGALPARDAIYWRCPEQGCDYVIYESEKSKPQKKGGHKSRHRDKLNGDTLDDSQATLPGSQRSLAEMFRSSAGGNKPNSVPSGGCQLVGMGCASGQTSLIRGCDATLPGGARGQCVTMEPTLTMKAGVSISGNMHEGYLSQAEVISLPDLPDGFSQDFPQVDELLDSDPLGLFTGCSTNSVGPAGEAQPLWTESLPPWQKDDEVGRAEETGLGDNQTDMEPLQPGPKCAQQYNSGGPCVHHMPLSPAYAANGQPCVRTERSSGYGQPECTQNVDSVMSVSRSTSDAAVECPTVNHVPTPPHGLDSVQLLGSVGSCARDQLRIAVEGNDVQGALTAWRALLQSGGGLSDTETKLLRQWLSSFRPLPPQLTTRPQDQQGTSALSVAQEMPTPATVGRVEPPPKKMKTNVHDEMEKPGTVWQHPQAKQCQQQQPTPAMSLCAGHVARLEITGCGNASVSTFVRGHYTMSGQNHGRPFFKKDQSLGGADVMLYYWDERDGLSYCGWWIGPKLGSDRVWAFCPGNWAMTPPRGGWKVPYNGAVDDTLVLNPLQEQHKEQDGQQLRQRHGGHQEEPQCRWQPGAHQQQAAGVRHPDGAYPHAGPCKPQSARGHASGKPTPSIAPHLRHEAAGQASRVGGMHCGLLDSLEELTGIMMDEDAVENHAPVPANKGKKKPKAGRTREDPRFMRRLCPMPDGSAPCLREVLRQAASLPLGAPLYNHRGQVRRLLAKDGKTTIGVQIKLQATHVKGEPQGNANVWFKSTRVYVQGNIPGREMVLAAVRPWTDAWPAKALHARELGRRFYENIPLPSELL